MTLTASPSVAASAAKYFNDNFTAVLATGTVVQSAYTAPATQAFADWKVANADKKFYLVAGDQGGVSQLLKMASGGTKPQNAVEVDQNVAYGIESAQLSPTDWLMARIADEFRATSTAQSLGPALNQTPEPDLSFDISSLGTADLRRLLKALGGKADDEKRDFALGNLADRRDALARLGLSREYLSIALDLQSRFAEEAVAMEKEAVADNTAAGVAAANALGAAGAADAAAAAAANAAAKADPRSASLDKAATDALAAAVTARAAANVAVAAFGETSARLAEFPVFEKMVNDALANLVAQSTSEMAAARTAADLFDVTRSAAGALNSTLQGAADRMLAKFDQTIEQFGSVLDLQQGTGAYVLNTASAQAREALVQMVKADLVKALREPSKAELLQAAVPLGQGDAAPVNALPEPRRAELVRAAVPVGQGDAALVRALREPSKAELLQAAMRLGQGDVALGVVVGVPVLLSAGAMGNLSTSDLLQVIRATARKTANELIVATMEMVKSQQATIRLKSADKIATLNDTITKLAEAEAKRKEMEAIKIGMMILGGLMVLLAIVVAVASLGTASAASAGMVAASASTMAAATAAAAAATTAAVTAVTVAAVSTIMFATMTALSESKDSNGVSQMDKLMAKLAKSLAPAGSEDPEADGAAAATGVMVGIQVAIMLIIAVATMGTGLPGAMSGMLSSVASTVSSAATAAVNMAVRIATQSIMETVKMVAKVVMEAIKSLVAAAQAAAKAVAETVKTAAETATAHLQMGGAGGAMRLVASLAKEAAKDTLFVARTMTNATNLTQGAMTVVQADNQMELAGIEQEVAMGKAEVEKLKALIKYLEALIQGDMEFAQALAEIQALLDKGVAELIRNLHGSIMKMEENRFSPSN